MEEETDKSTIKLPPFSGKQADWQVWSEKFLARASRKGFKDVLLGRATVPPDSEVLDLSKSEDKKKKKLRDANDYAYEALILLINGETSTGRVAFSIVRNCKTKDLADGDVAMAWKRLCDKYEPKSAPLRLALKNEFNSKNLRSVKHDPDVWLTELEDLRMQLLNAGSTLSEDDLLEHALNNLPREYDVVVSKLEDRLSSKTDPLTIEDLRTQLNLR